MHTVLYNIMILYLKEKYHIQPKYFEGALQSSTLNV